MSNLSKLIVKNAPSILIGLGAIGVVSTAYLSGKATVKAYKRLRDDESIVTRRDVLSSVWRYYVPSIISGMATCACIFGANSAHLRRNAAVLGAYTLTSGLLDDYKVKVADIVGERKAQEALDDVHQERIKKTKAPDLLVSGDSLILCYESLSGRYFKSTVEELRKAQNDFNSSLIHGWSASLNELYTLINLPECVIGDLMGWNADNMLEFQFSSTLTTDDKPCLVVDYVRSAIVDYQNTR